MRYACKLRKTPKMRLQATAKLPQRRLPMMSRSRRKPLLKPHRLLSPRCKCPLQHLYQRDLRYEIRPSGLFLISPSFFTPSTCFVYVTATV